MLVAKTINNNIVECTSSDGKSLIAMGRGIGFDFKAGSTLPEERIERTFSMDEKTRGYGNIRTLFSSVPEELLDICISIIDNAKQSLNTTLNDSIYITLTDHLHFAISKAEDGIDFHSALSGEVKVFYPGEYMMGLSAIEAIREKMGVSLPKEEACTIALHIVNAEYNSSIGSVLKITRAIAEIIDIIKHYTGLEIRDDMVDGAALISYLKYFVFRVFTGAEAKVHTADRFPSILERELDPVFIRVTDEVEKQLYALAGKKMSELDRASLSTNLYFFREYSKRRSI